MRRERVFVAQQNIVSQYGAVSAVNAGNAAAAALQGGHVFLNGCFELQHLRAVECGK